MVVTIRAVGERLEDLALIELDPGDGANAFDPLAVRERARLRGATVRLTS